MKTTSDIRDEKIKKNIKKKYGNIRKFIRRFKKRYQDINQP
jgi:membrane glycosyltransferase